MLTLQLLVRIPVSSSFTSQLAHPPPRPFLDTLLCHFSTVHNADNTSQLFCSETLEKYFHQSPMSQTSSNSVRVVMKSVMALNMATRPAPATSCISQMLGQLQFHQEIRRSLDLYQFFPFHWVEGLFFGNKSSMCPQGRLYANARVNLFSMTCT